MQTVKPDSSATEPQWNAYAAAGANKKELSDRLRECPFDFRRGVMLHVQTVISLRKYHENLKRNKRR